MVSKALVMGPNDNVATVIEDVEPGTSVPVTVEGKTRNIKVKQRIPFGHKFAVSKISKGDKVIKYGEVIGLATQPIEEGEHVHVQNVESVYSKELVQERRERK
nr:UxaA family hydrolase [Candidatus Freyarchaeota archaeon]